jgi:DNA polymerase-3 subunit gamma/tau
MRDLAAHLRHLFVVQTLGEVPDSFAVTAEHTDRLGAQASRLAQGEVLRAIDLLAAAMSAVKDGSDPRIQLELALLKAVQPQADMSLQALLFRIEQLEARLAQTRPASNAPPADGGTGHRAQGTGQAPPAPAVSAPPSVAAPRAESPQPATARAEAPQAAAPSDPAPAVAAAVAEPEPEVVPAVAAEPVELDLERLRQLWTAVVDEVCKQNGMVGAFLADARPCAVADGRLKLRFGAGAGFGKKKVESNKALVQVGVKAVTGSLVAIECELAEVEDEQEEPAPMAGPPVMTEDELVERLKGEFGAREVFDEPESEES